MHKCMLFILYSFDNLNNVFKHTFWILYLMVYCSQIIHSLLKCIMETKLIYTVIFENLFFCIMWSRGGMWFKALSYRPLAFHCCGLTLKMPRKPASENVVCLCCLLNILANFSNLFLHTGKQYGPRSDCSKGAVIWVHTVCKNDF